MGKKLGEHQSNVEQITMEGNLARVAKWLLIIILVGKRTQDRHLLMDVDDQSH